MLREAEGPVMPMHGYADSFAFMKKRSKRRSLFRRSILLAVLLFTIPVIPFSRIAGAQSPDAQALPFFAKEIPRLKERILVHERHEAEALQALEQAGKARDLAIGKNNAEARGIAGEAVALAEEALSDVRKRKVREQARLNAMEKSLKGKSGAIDFGVAGMIKGEVFRKTGSVLLPFDGKSPVVAGNILETGKDGFLEVALPDYSYVSMGANTSMAVLELNVEKKQSLYDVVRREFHLGKLNIQRKCYLYGRDECWTTRYRITPGVHVAVRGTVFDIEQTPDGGTTLAVFEGALEIKEGNAVETVKVNAMEQLRIGQDGSIDGPMAIKADPAPRWWDY